MGLRNEMIGGISRALMGQRRPRAADHAGGLTGMPACALLAGLALMLACEAGAAMAQEASGAPADAGQDYSNFRRDRNVSVRQRPHPGYEAHGLRAGDFTLWPKLNTTLEYNDNVFATADDRRSDTVWHVSPELDLTSNWSRHQLDVFARAILNRFTDITTENTDDYSVGANGQFEFTRKAQASGGLSWNQLTEPRSSAASLGQPRPVQYQLSTAYVSGVREFDLWRLSGRFDAQNFIYLSQTGNTPQNDRDRAIYVLTGRADYAISPQTALFLQVAGNDRDYRLEASPSVLSAYPGFQDRDSKGVEALVGANFEFSTLWRGEFGLGYLHQSYDNSRFKDLSGLGARAQIEWFPTRITTVTFSGSRTLEDAGITGASDYLSTNIGVQLDHELLRNVILSGLVAYGDDDYRGIDRNDKRYSAGISGTYLLNRLVGVTVGYSHLKQTSRGLEGSGDFTVDKIGATLALQY